MKSRKPSASKVLHISFTLGMKEEQSNLTYLYLSMNGHEKMWNNRIDHPLN